MPKKSVSKFNRRPYEWRIGSRIDGAIFLAMVFSMMLGSCSIADRANRELSGVRISSQKRRALVKWAMLTPQSPNLIRIDIGPPREETARFMQSIRWASSMPAHLGGHVVLHLDDDGTVIKVDGAFTEERGKKFFLSPEPGFFPHWVPNRNLTIQILKQLNTLGLL